MNAAVKLSIRVCCSAVGACQTSDCRRAQHHAVPAPDSRASRGGQGCGLPSHIESHEGASGRTDPAGSRIHRSVYRAVEIPTGRELYEPGFSVGRQYKVLEQLGVEEPWIRLPSGCPIARAPRIGRYGEILPYLETHLEPFGNLMEIPLKLIGIWRTVERRGIAHSPEQWFSLILILVILS